MFSCFQNVPSNNGQPNADWFSFIQNLTSNRIRQNLDAILTKLKNWHYKQIYWIDIRNFINSFSHIVFGRLMHLPSGFPVRFNGQQWDLSTLAPHCAYYNWPFPVKLRAGHCIWSFMKLSNYLSVVSSIPILFRGWIQKETDNSVYSIYFASIPISLLCCLYNKNNANQIMEIINITFNLCQKHQHWIYMIEEINGRFFLFLWILCRHLKPTVMQS